MSNAVVSLAIIGKNNEPMYMKEFIDPKEELRKRDLVDESELFGIAADTATPGKENENNSQQQQSQQGPFHADRVSPRQEFILHAALDRFEQLAGPPPGFAWRRQHTTSEVNPMFVGLLESMQDLKVYGWMTTTQIKILCVVLDDPSSSLSSHLMGKRNSLVTQNNKNDPGASSTMTEGGLHLSPHRSTPAPQQPSGRSFRNAEIVVQQLFVALHQCYVSYVLNPFSPLNMTSNASIVSPQFDQQIQTVVTRHNQACLQK